MDSSLNGDQQAVAGSFPAARFRSIDQESLFAEERMPWVAFLRKLVRGEDLRKRVGSKCYEGRDPDKAADNLVKVLDATAKGENRRHFAAAWLDHVADVLGEEGREAIVRFVCRRYGYQMPERIPDPKRREERLAAIATSAERVVGVVADLRDELAEMREELRKERER